MLHAHFAQPADGDDYTWPWGDVPDLVADQVHDPADVLRLENESLRTQLLQARIATAQLAAAFHRLESVLSEGA